MKNEKELILKMLEEHKISSEEALKLIEYLENNSEKNTNKNTGNKKSSNLGNMISSIVKNTVENAFSTAAKAGNISINFGNKCVSRDFSHSYILKDPIPNSIDSLNLNLYNGEIVIKTDDDIDSPQLKVYTHNRAEENEIENIFEINFDNNYLTISEKHKSDYIQKINFSDNYKIELLLPNSENYSFFTLSTLNGDIRIEEISLNDIKVNTSNGDINIEEVCAKSLNAITSNGDICLENININDVKAITSRGDIEFCKFKVNNINANTSMGDISIDYAFEVDEFINCSTSMGDIDVDLEELAADIELDASVTALMGELNISDRFLLASGSKHNRKVYTNTNFKKNVYVHLNTSFGDINVD